MSSRRFSTVTAATCQTVVVAACVVSWFAGFGSAGVQNNGAAPIADRHPSSLAADTGLADAPQATAPASIAVDNADTATTAQPVTATDTTVASNETESISEAALSDSPRMPPSEEQPVRVALANPSDPVPNDTGDTVSSIEILDECLAVDVCIDRYLWALYQRTPKEDTIKMHEQRKVTVKKRGKMVTVTRSFTRLVDEDFTWKDPKAAERTGKPMMEYVIGGMDRSFKVKLYHTLYAAEQAGLSPGITSAFRDDYRQSIASGLKAASNRSFHGGSLRGGYGHGLAADVVSVKGGTRDQRWSSSEKLWKWIDAHGKEFGIGRPYSDRDPPHLAPTDGKEYAAHHHGPKAQVAGSNLKKHSRVAARDDRSAAKRARTAKSSKVRTT